MSHRIPGQECCGVSGTGRGSSQPEGLSLSLIFTFLNLHLILLSSSLVDSLILALWWKLCPLTSPKRYRVSHSRGEHCFLFTCHIQISEEKLCSSTLTNESTAGPVTEDSFLLATICWWERWVVGRSNSNFSNSVHLSSHIEICVSGRESSRLPESFVGDPGCHCCWCHLIPRHRTLLLHLF